VFLICSRYEYIPKYRPPLKEKATRSIDSYKKVKLRNLATMPAQKPNHVKKPHWDCSRGVPTGSDETFPSAWKAFAVACKFLLTK
jgi:hypothetical protein